MTDGLAESAIAHTRRAGMLCQNGRFRESLPHFASAEADLDALAARGARCPPGYENLPRQVQDGWLTAIVTLAHGGELDGDTVRSAIARCDRVLALTDSPTDGDAVEVREHALYQRARHLTLLGKYDEAQSSALELLRVLPRQPPGRTSRDIEKQMRRTVACARWDQGDHGAAEAEFLAILGLALVDDDVPIVDLALGGLSLIYRRQPARLARALDRSPADATDAGARGAEARCRNARASAWDATPGPPDEARSLGIADEFLRAARSFADLGEAARQAKAVHAAAARLSVVALVHPEHRAQAEQLMVEAERLFREVGDWHGVGVAASGLAELHHGSDPGVPVDADRVLAALERSIDAYCRADRPQEEAGALLLRAELTARHDESPDRFVEQCLEAFSAYERGRADRLLSSERETHDQGRDLMFGLLGPRIANHLAHYPEDPRCADLVWGLEQIVKARSMQDQLAAPDLWPRFLARDGLLRSLNHDLEQARAELEPMQRVGENLEADALHDTIDRLERRLRERLQDVADDAELDLASTPVPGWRDLQAVLRPGELYVGLVFCRDDLFLRCRLTSNTERFDAVSVPELMVMLLGHVAIQPLPHDQLARTRRLAWRLLGPVEPGIETILICPDRQLVAVPWHLLEPDRPRQFLGDQVTIAVVPAAGALVSTRRRAARSAVADRAYLGVSHADQALTTVDEEVEHIRTSYFADSGRCLLTGDGHRMVDETGHVGLLHVASHAVAAGLVFGSRTITPIALAGTTLTADVLLLTGCYLGAFDRSDRNEFVGIVRQLLLATGAGAAVVSAAPVPQEAGNVFSDLVVSGLTGKAPRAPWSAPAPAPAAAMPVGEAVAWARVQMRAVRGPRKDPWWSPWFVVGDPSVGLRGIR